MTRDLFMDCDAPNGLGLEARGPASLSPQRGQAALGQFFTPVWAAEALIESYFGKLGSLDMVVEPSCGPGAFLQALPSYIPAIGIEIDPALANMARAASGRKIITGDFRTLALDFKATAVIGNPPFQSDLIHQFLRRTYDLLEPEGVAGFILPAYFYQTPSALLEVQSRFAVQAELLPRTLFPGLSTPLIFTMLRKGVPRTLAGFALYQETQDVNTMPKGVRETLRRGAGSVWRQAVADVVRALGGEAELCDIYKSMGPSRPTGNAHWKAKVRQVCQSDLERTGRGRYALAA